MTWAKSFRELYLDRYRCDPPGFETHLLKRTLHRRALPLHGMIRKMMPNYFDLEFRTIRYLGNARSSEEFRSELDSYRSEYRRHGGFLRNTLAIRLSGQRLMNVLMDLLPERKDRPDER
jgi:hypothetical protein